MDTKTRELVEKHTPFAKHALRVDKGGDWFHCLQKFPGVLFDAAGFLVFDTEQEYLSHPSLQHNPASNTLIIPGGISSLAGYKRFGPEEEQS